MKRKYILFDLDGTLTDSQEGIMNSIEYALDFFNISIENRSALRPWLGPPLKDSLINHYGFTRENALIAVTKFREYFDKQGIFENQVYSGVENLLSQLQTQGYILMIATSKPESAAKRITDHFDLTKYFTFVGGATLDDSRVKKEDVVRYVLQTNKITDVSQAIMVGDREHDIFGAKKNGLESIGVLYGYGSLEELKAAGADYIAHTTAEVAGFFDS